MALDATKPTDQVLNAELPKYIRETREAINSIETLAGDVSVTKTTIAGGTSSLDIDNDLSDNAIEIILISSTGNSEIQQITGGTQGQLKIFIMQDADISFKDGNESGGEIYLNQTPAGSTFSCQKNDVLALVNIDGDGSSNNGYWKEVFRLEAVK